MSTIVTANRRRGGRQRNEILHRWQRFFDDKEEESSKKEFRKFQVLVGGIQDDMRRNPRQDRLGEEREELFDEATKQLVGRRLNDGRAIWGCIAHGKLSVANVMERIDRSIVVGVPDEQRVYHFNVTGPKWIERHLRARPNVKVVPVELEREREGVPKEVSIHRIKEWIVKLIEEDDSG